MSLGLILVIILVIFLLGGFSGRFGGYGYGYGDNCWQVRPVYDGYGNFLGNRPVNVCQ